MVPARAQVCGYLELEKARKRERMPKVEKTLDDTGPQLAPKPAGSLHEEVEHAVRAFSREAREFRKDVNTAVEAAFYEKRATVDRTYEKHIRDIEAEEREWRQRAIAKLEEFIARYPDDPEHTPGRLAQLGELYFEESNEVFTKRQDDYEKALEAYRKTKLGPEPEPPVQRYDKTVALFQRLVSRFPEYRDIDGIYYLLGYALSNQGDEGQAAQVYETFVVRFPRSKFIPEVWTRLGEFYFEQRPRAFAKAINAYLQVLPYKESAYFDKALYKLAWAYYLDNQFERGVDRFVQLVRFSDQEKARLGKAGSELRSEAIQYIGLSFTEEGWGSVDKAAKWFEGQTAAWARDALERLADLLFDATRYKDAIQAYQLVLGRFPTHPEAPRMLGCQVVAYRNLRDFANEARVAEQISPTFGPGSPWYEVNKVSKKALAEVDNLAQGALLAAATFRHKQANVFADAGQLGKARVEYSTAADLYRRFIERFPAHKEVYELMFYLAETLYYAFRFEEASAVYERVRDDKEDKGHQIEAALGAYKSLENWIESQKMKMPELPKLTKDGQAIEGGPGPDPLPPHVLRLVDAGKRFLAFAPKHEQTSNVAYSLAEAYYRYKDFKEARVRFAKIVDDWPNSKAALNSARLLVDSYRLTQDWANVEKWTRRLIAAKIAEGSERRALEEELGKIKTGALFKRAEAMQKAGQFEEAAREYIRLADENPKTEFADVALYNAGANYEQIRKYESANRAYEKLLQRYPQSPRADKALFRIAVNAENFFEFDRAVKAYLRLYREYKQSDKRDWALYNAALSLENDQKYSTAAMYFLTYAREFPEKEDAPTSFFRAGTLYIKAKRYAEARRTFAQFVARYGAEPRYRGLAIDAQAKIADSYFDEGNQRLAVREARKTAEAFDRSGFGPGSPAAVVAARARFLDIEQDFEVFRGRKITGSAQKQGEALVELIKFMKRLEDDYRAISRFKVLDWYLAALFRIGHLYQLLSQKILDAPLPAELKTQEEKDAYRTQLEDRAGVLERKAVANFEVAYGEGRKQGVQNEWTRRALEALAVLNPVKYQVLKEPRTAAQIESVSPAPIVRAAPGALGPKKGGEWKPGGK